VLRNQQLNRRLPNLPPSLLLPKQRPLNRLQKPRLPNPPWQKPQRQNQRLNLLPSQPLELPPLNRLPSQPPNLSRLKPPQPSLLQNQLLNPLQKLRQNPPLNRLPKLLLRNLLPLPSQPLLQNQPLQNRLQNQQPNPRPSQQQNRL
jgi:hypothetical protein